MKERKKFPTNYQKPRIVKKEIMRFPMDIIEASGRGVVCKQCSSCHNCR